LMTQTILGLPPNFPPGKCGKLLLPPYRCPPMKWLPTALGSTLLPQWRIFRHLWLISLLSLRSRLF
jgi:hypothetical protein